MSQTNVETDHRNPSSTRQTSHSRPGRLRVAGVQRSIRLVSIGAVATVLARLAWAAWRFYFSGAPRYPLETASIALAAIVPMVVLSAPSDRRAPWEVSANDDGAPPIALPLFVAAAFVAYAPALGLGLLSDDFVLRAAAQAGAAVTGPG